MSKEARRLARGLAAVILRECRTEEDVAVLLYPVCLRADAGSILKREMRRAAARRERIVREAARAAPPARGFADLTPGRFVTTLAAPPAQRQVNGHALDISSESLTDLFPRPEFE